MMNKIVTWAEDKWQNIHLGVFIGIVIESILAGSRVSESMPELSMSALLFAATMIVLIFSTILLGLARTAMYFVPSRTGEINLGLIALFIVIFFL